MTKRREFSRSTKAAIMLRCKTPTGFRCENPSCGAIVQSGEIDHVIAEALIVDKSKKLTAEDGRFLCWECHQGPGGKTPKDKAAIAKAKRCEAAALGIKSESPRPLQSRNTLAIGKTPRISKTPVVNTSRLARWAAQGETK